MDKAIEVKTKDESPLRTTLGPLSQTFITDIQKQGKDMSYREYYKILEKHVDEWDLHMDTVLQKHEQDFLNAFKCQMFGLYAQLKELKKKNDENELRLKRDEKINALQKSLDWFREEADKWKAKAESLQDDRNFLENQLKNAKRKMKIMQNEKKDDSDSDDSLKSSLSHSNALITGKFTPTSKTGEIILGLYEKNPVQVSLLYELERFFHDLEIKYNESIKHLKNTLDNERKKIKQITANQSSLFFIKSDLENLFLECVEEVRKDISKRKAKNLVDQKYNKRAKTSKPEDRETMTPSDKRKILELLISNEQVLIILYEKLFPHRASQYGNSIKPEDKNGDETLPNLEEMMKQVPRKPNIPKTMSFQNRGRSVV